MRGFRLVVCLLLAACTRVAVDGTDGLVELAFAVKGNVTRSSFQGSVDAVEGVVVFLYREGRLEAVAESDNGKAVLRLSPQSSYNAYAVANVSDFVPPSREEDLESMHVTVPSLSELGMLPMCWKMEGLIPGRAGVVDIELDRLIAEIRFSIDPSLIPGVEVTSVRLRNAPSVVYPFADGGSRAIRVSQTVDGDYAIQDDIVSLNAGDPMVLYVPENCQGCLLPDNRDPVSKLPDSLGNPELCTYLEVGCVFAGSSPFDGSVTYRLYPGLDECTDFSLVRNLRYMLSLCLTPGGLDEVSWRVETDAGYREGQVSVTVNHGIHHLDDLYVGEVSKLEVTVAPSLETVVGESLHDYRLVLYDSEGKVSDCIAAGPLYREGERLFCDVLSLAPTDPSQSYRFSLVTGDRSAAAAENVTVRTPLLAARAGTTFMTPVINGPESSFDVYLTDRRGQNLNSRVAYGFDLSLFADLMLDCELNPRLDEGNAELNRQICACHLFRCTPGSECSDGPAATCHVRISNPGLSGALNHEFSRLLGMDILLDDGIWTYVVSSANAEAATLSAGLDILPVHVWYYGDLTQYGSLSVRSYGAQENDAYLAVSNPSHVELAADVWTLGYGNIGRSALPGTSVVGFTTSDEDCAAEVAGSVTSFAVEPEKTERFYRSVVDGFEVDCYPLVVNSGNSFKSIAGMQRTLNDSGKSWKSGQADIVLSTVSGNPVYYHVHDIYGSTSSAEYGAVIGDRGFSGLSSWGPDDISFSRRDRFTSILGDYRPSWVNSVITDIPMSVSAFWDQTYGLRLSAFGNTFGTSFMVSVKATFKAACNWQKNSNDSSHTERYETTVTYSPSALFSGVSATATILSRGIVDAKFAEINKDYWHECSTNLGNLPGNRFARLALPVSVDFVVTIIPQNQKWTPCVANVTATSSSVTGYSIYNNTKRGTYPVNGTRTNPDGSSRGDHDSASDVAAKYADYVPASSSAFDISVSVEGLRFMHRM